MGVSRCYRASTAPAPGPGPVSRRPQRNASQMSQMSQMSLFSDGTLGQSARTRQIISTKNILYNHGRVVRQGKRPVWSLVRVFDSPAAEIVLPLAQTRGHRACSCCGRHARAARDLRRRQKAKGDLLGLSVLRAHRMCIISSLLATARHHRETTDLPQGPRMPKVPAIRSQATAGSSVLPLFPGLVFADPG